MIGLFLTDAFDMGNNGKKAACIQVYNLPDRYVIAKKHRRFVLVHDDYPTLLRSLADAIEEDPTLDNIEAEIKALNEAAQT
jgi:hypothetical protein